MTDNEGGPPGDENHLIAERRAKLARLRERGNPFPNDFRRNALAADLNCAYGGRSTEALETDAVRVSVAGRLRAKRVMGKASFARLEDSSGAIQLFLQQQALGTVYDEFKGWDVGDMIGADGALFRTKTGELSIRVDRLVLLTKSLRPLPDKWHGIADTEMRYRRRYVDLIMNEGSRRVFEMRSKIVRYLRAFLDARGFLEVETPMLHPIPGGAAARPFKTHHNALDVDMYLRIAPELYLKRLTVGGFERVYEINRNFRNEGVSTKHNPEFTMLELYQAYADYDDLMEMIESLFQGTADCLLGTRKLVYQGTEYDLSKRFARMTIEEIILANNPDLDPMSLRDANYLRRVCDQMKIGHKAGDGPGKLQIEIFEKTGEHTLIQPTFAYAYPAEVSPLSRRNDHDPFITDRWEFFIGGRELANGFSELNDSEDQAQRFKDQVERKEAGDEEAMYYDADYIRALEYGMPPTAGLGLGVDRMVMLFTDSPSIRDVLLFPHMRPEF
ncbi:MAG TPA: lysine--tRNA ligase [Steroidobacteraceae bacterium]|nr:lysine--tRNA ligase [Steroidobacteraceae bacterium]